MLLLLFIISNYFMKIYFKIISLITVICDRVRGNQPYYAIKIDFEIRAPKVKTADYNEFLFSLK